MKFDRFALLAVVILLLAAGCGDDDAAPTTSQVATTATAPTTTAAPATTTTTSTTTTSTTTTTTTTVTATTEPPGETVKLSPPDADGNVTAVVDPMALAPLSAAFNDDNPDDPFYHLHTQQEDVFVGIELYTLYGNGWTGELGTFPTDCGTHGICVYFDPDGVGPVPGMGPGVGTITISGLEGDTVVTLDEVVFQDPDGMECTVVGLTLGG